tara:strand:+ start:49 stop:621 length:573 start_codon:yes stop_codon:yes gene_type:complete
MIKEKNIKIIDNFLDKEVFKKLQAFLLSSQCAWFYNEKIVDYTQKSFKNPYPVSLVKGYEVTDAHQFTHTFLRNQAHWSDATPHIEPLLSKINSRFWIRIKGNLSSIYSTPIVGGWHCDCETDEGTPWMDTITSIFYINTNNGSTLLENGKKISCVENRLAIFPNHMAHTGVSQTDTKIKVTLNLNYLDK